jgi:glyoxylase-like metal-dependent hydrolase (beta-lactamase superfamily II)
VFTGDTLFAGGPGATGRSYSSFDTIIESIRTTLLTLPGATAVRTGHGGSTSVGDEAPHLRSGSRGALTRPLMLHTKCYSARMKEAAATIGVRELRQNASRYSPW